MGSSRIMLRNCSINSSGLGIFLPTSLLQLPFFGSWIGGHDLEIEKGREEENKMALWRLCKLVESEDEHSLNLQAVFLE